MTPKIVSLFSGYGGLEMGVQSVIGGRVIAHVEFDDAPSAILAHHWPDVPNLGDVSKVDWDAFLVNHPELMDRSRTYRPGLVLVGGFPCQDVSLAGARRGLQDGTRSGLWSHFARAIGALRPELVLIENVRGLLSADGEPWHDELIQAAEAVARASAALTLAERFTERNTTHVAEWRRARVRTARSLKRAMARLARERRLVRRAIDTVLRDLADLGYDATWGGLRAADAGAPHGRFRVFILARPADTDSDGLRSVRWLVESRRDTDGRSRTHGPRFAGEPSTPAADAGGRGRKRGTAQPTPAEWRGWDAARDDRGPAAPHPDDRGRDGRAQDAVGDSIGRAAASGGGRCSRCGEALEPNRGDVFDGTWCECASADADDSADDWERARPGPAVGGGDAAADARGARLGEHAGESPAEEAGPLGRDVAAGARGSRPDRGWGPYRPAVERWERITGRVAPSPTNPDGRDGAHRLAPEFVEWMMGLPSGHVTSAPVTRSQMLKALGNGVVPQQAALALATLLARADWVLAA